MGGRLKIHVLVYLFFWTETLENINISDKKVITPHLATRLGMIKTINFHTESLMSFLIALEHLRIMRLCLNYRIKRSRYSQSRFSSC